MKVEIDGVRYVPDTEVQPMADGAQRAALRALLVGLYLYQRPERGLHGCLWDAINALAPGLANQCEDDVRIMLGVVDPEFGKEDEP